MNTNEVCNDLHKYLDTMGDYNYDNTKRKKIDYLFSLIYPGIV